MNSTFLIIASSVIAVFMGSTMIFIRAKASKKPTSIKRIILPPIFMSTGAVMFLLPEFRVSFLEVMEALTAGVVFSFFLIKTTKFELKDKEVYLIPSKAFIFILIGLFAFRLIIKTIIGSHISFGETSGMFFLLAFGMIVSWRIAMVIKFYRLKRNLKRDTIKEVNMH